MESSTANLPRGRDRRQTRRFVLWNRRSGFDRRQAPNCPPFSTELDPSLSYLRDHPGVLVALLALANLLSMIDLGLTSVALRLGAVEVNPFMRYVFEAGATQTAIVKCGIVLAASLGIWSLRRRRAALLIVPFLVALYAALVHYEMVGLALLI